MKLTHSLRVLRDIKQLRERQNAAFLEEKWLTVQTINEKIKKLWEIYHGLEQIPTNKRANIQPVVV